MTEHAQLMAMDFDGRLDWMRQHATESRVFPGQYRIKVDGHLAALGYEHSFEEMLAAFLMFIARAAMPRSEGGTA